MNDANTSSTALSDAILTPPASLQFGLEKICPRTPHKNQKRLKRQKRAGGERDGDDDEEGLSSAPDARPGDVSGTLADEATSRRSGRLSPEWSCDSPRVEVSTCRRNEPDR